MVDDDDEPQITSNVFSICNWEPTSAFSYTKERLCSHSKPQKCLKLKYSETSTRVEDGSLHLNGTIAKHRNENFDNEFEMDFQDTSSRIRIIR